MEDALEQAVREINHGYTGRATFDAITRQGVAGILKRYYKGHAVEILEMLESQHSVADTFGFEGTD